MSDAPTAQYRRIGWRYRLEIVSALRRLTESAYLYGNRHRAGVAGRGERSTAAACGVAGCRSMRAVRVPMTIRRRSYRGESD